NPTETRRCPCKQASGCRGRGSSARSAPRASSALRRRAHARPPSRKYLLIANLAVLAPYRRDFTTWRLHEGLHTHRTMWIVQVHLIEEAPLYGAFAEPSDGLEPSTPSLPWRFRVATAVGRNRAREAVFPAFPTIQALRLIFLGD